MNTRYHLGDTHEFTTVSKSKNIILKAGQGETLTIQGTVSGNVAGNLLQQAILSEIYPSKEDAQVYTRTDIGNLSALGSQWLITNQIYAFNIFRYNGTTFDFFQNLDLAVSTDINPPILLDIFDESGTPTFATFIYYTGGGTSGAVSFGQFNGSVWVGATYDAAYSFLNAFQNVRDVSLLNDTTCFALADATNNVYKIVKTGGIWQNRTIVYTDSALGLPLRIKTNQLDEIVVSYASNIRIFNSAFTLTQTITNADAGYGLDLSFNDTYLTVISNTRLYIYRKIGATYTLVSNTLFVATLKSVTIDRKSSKFVVINTLSSNQQFIMYRSGSTWTLQSRNMTYPSVYGTTKTMGAYEPNYMTSNITNQSIYVNKLVIYEGLTTVASLSIDQTDYSIDLMSIKDVNIVIRDTNKMVINENGVQLSDALSLNIGSQIKPSYTFNGNSNTGLYSSALDTINFTTAGTSKFVINTTVTSTAPLRTTDTTVSSSTTTGALVVTGGTGIGGSTNIGGVTRVTNTTASTSTTTGAVIVSGGMGVQGALNVESLYGARVVMYNADVVYTALTTVTLLTSTASRNGIVTAYTEGISGNWNWNLSLLVDSFTPPTQKVNACSINSVSGTDYPILTNSFSFPVRKGDTYRVNGSFPVGGIGGTIRTYVLFIPVA